MEKIYRNIRDAKPKYELRLTSLPKTSKSLRNLFYSQKSHEGQSVVICDDYKEELYQQAGVLKVFMHNPNISDDTLYLIVTTIEKRELSIKHAFLVIDLDDKEHIRKIINKILSWIWPQKLHILANLDDTNQTQFDLLPDAPLDWKLYSPEIYKFATQYTK